jgi:hypothetical protein
MVFSLNYLQQVYQIDNSMPLVGTLGINLRKGFQTCCLLHDPKKDTIIQMTAEILRGLLTGNPVAMHLLAKDGVRPPSQLVSLDQWGERFRQVIKCWDCREAPWFSREITSK